MNQSDTPDAGHAGTPDQIPTLTQDMALDDVPQAVTLVLDARAAEKQALMALSDELIQKLRPEIERLTTDMVQKTLQGVWDHRARMDQDI